MKDAAENDENAIMSIIDKNNEDNKAKWEKWQQRREQHAAQHLVDFRAMDERRIKAAQGAQERNIGPGSA